MRLFTAVELEPQTLQGAAVLIDELRRRADDCEPRAKLTWVPADRLHLTLRFIGEVDDEMARRIMDALREPLALAPFGVAFELLGSFPPSGPPRVLWIGVGAGRDMLIRAEAAISERLAPIGVPREDRAFAPHLTIARVRAAASLRPRRLFDGLTSTLEPTRVDAITLFRSRLSPKGAAYTVLQRTTLESAGAGPAGR